MAIPKLNTKPKAKDCESLVFVAKLAERYEEMVEAMKEVARQGVEMTVEERNLLSVGYENVVGIRRASWRILSSIEHKEESRGNDANARRIRHDRNKLESELSSVCGDVIAVIDDFLVPSSASAIDFSVFLYKMGGLENLDNVQHWLHLVRYGLVERSS